MKSRKWRPFKAVRVVKMTLLGSSVSSNGGSKGAPGMRAPFQSRFFDFHAVFAEKFAKQECIPVGCVPAAHWPYAGVCFLGGGGLVLIPLNFPLGCGPGPDPPESPLGHRPGFDPPEFPPWVWAWIWSPSISPLGVGLDLIPLNFPLGCGPGPDPLNFPLGVGLEGGVSLAGGSPWQGGLLGRGWYPSMHSGRPPCEQNDRQV